MVAQISYLINNAESASVPNEIERFLQVSLRELHYAAQTLDTLATIRVCPMDISYSYF